MGKPNTYVQLLNAQQLIQQLQQQILLLQQKNRQEVELMKGFTIQQCQDMAIIALHNEFHFGPKMSKRFESAFRGTFKEYAKMCVADGKDDPDIVFTKEKVDRALRAACGNDVRPFDERYAPENLYFRDKLMKEKSNGT